MLDFNLKNKSLYAVNIALIGFILLMIIANQILVARAMKASGASRGSLLGDLSFLNIIKGKDGAIQLNGNLSKDAVALAINQGVPKIYGQELNVSFDQVESSMNVMKEFDPTYGRQKIVLQGADLQRYINIGLRISCEYCCGAAAIISKDGQAACGCAHSQAMRGLAAYLLQKHAAEYSDDEILRELARWKGRFFPKQMIEKLSGQLQSGNYTPDVAALVLGLKMPKYGGGSAEAPLPSEIKDLPGMVGGC